jgi:hydrogenase expression/formation protein HypE
MVDDSSKARLGKIDANFFDRVIYPNLGANDSNVILPPQHGVDFGVVDIGNGNVLAMSTDPLFIQPSLGWDRAAWFAFHIIVSDVAVSGLPPRYLTLDWNLPPEIGDEQFEIISRVFDREAKKLGMSIVTGHTARYSGCNFPMVGGATSMAIGPRSMLVTPKGACSGNKVVVTKGPAIETTGLLAVEFQELLKEAFGASFVEEARSVFYQMSPIQDAITASSVGGVTAMHDATECGIWGGLYEIAEASGVGLVIEKDSIKVQPVIDKTCGFFNIDPFKSISEGTLLLTVESPKVEELVKAMKEKGIPAYIAGDVVPRAQGIKMVKSGKTFDLEHPRIDPFWAVFAEYIQKRASHAK